MTKLELAVKILEIREKKQEEVKIQHFENAASLRDLEKESIKDFEEKYEPISAYTDSEFIDFIKLLKSEQRDHQIDDILDYE